MAKHPETPEVLALIERWQGGDRRAGDALIRQFTPWIWRYVRAHPCALEHDDAYQACCLGFLRAADKFDPAFPNLLMTYSPHTMRAALQKEESNTTDQHRGWRTQPAKTIRRAVFTVAKVWAQPPWEVVSSEAGIQAVAARADVDPEEVRHRRRLFSSHESAQALGPDQSPTHRDRHVNYRTPHDALARSEFQARLERETKDLLRTLPARERFIIQRRFLRDPPWTLQRLGDRWGLTRERARQLEAQALQRLRINVDPRLRAWLRERP